MPGNDLEVPPEWRYSRPGREKRGKKVLAISVTTIL